MSEPSELERVLAALDLRARNMLNDERQKEYADAARRSAPEVEAVTDTEQEAAERAKFEAWITAPPYEYNIHRTPLTSSFAWAGQYRHSSVQLAWEAWKEAKGIK